MEKSKKNETEKVKVNANFFWVSMLPRSLSSTAISALSILITPVTNIGT